MRYSAPCQYDGFAVWYLEEDTDETINTLHLNVPDPAILFWAEEKLPDETDESGYNRLCSFCSDEWEWQVSGGDVREREYMRGVSWVAV